MKPLLEVMRCYAGLDWHKPDMLALLPNMLELAVRNKVVCVLDDVVKKAYASEVPERIGQALDVIGRHEQGRAREQWEEALRISFLLDGEDISHAVRKGGALAHLYRDALHRQYEDIDLLIHPDDAVRLHDVLRDDGYLPGSYDRYAEQPKLPDRAARLQYRLSPDHMPHLHRPAPGTLVKAFVVDVAFTSGWHGDAFDLDNGGALARVIRRQGLPTLDDVDSFVNVALHLYREAFLPGTVMRSAPSLRSFLDVLLCHRALANTQLVWQRHEGDALRQALVQTLALVGRVFNEELLRDGPAFSDEHLLHAMIRDGRHVRVGVSLIDRMAALSHGHYAALMAAQPA